MNFDIKTTNIELNTELSEHLDKRMGALDKLIDPTDSSVLCNVEVGKTTRHHKQGEIFRAEINLERGGKLFRAESTKENLFDAIDEAQKKVLRELRRDKRRTKAFVRKGAQQAKDWLKRIRRGR